MIFLEKDILTSLEVIELNELLFNNNRTEQHFSEQRYKAYDKQTILRILKYQHKEKINNKELAAHFKLSINTIKNWRKVFAAHLNTFYFQYF